jgi:hypothetical protein
MRTGWAIAIAVMMTAGAAQADFIHLSHPNFYADPTVTVSPDNSSAGFVENLTTGISMLSNDPFLGDPVVILAAPWRTLEFDYIFDVGEGSEAEFGAWVINPATGFSLGDPFQFFRSESGNGRVAFDLTSLVGTEGLGLQFQLTSLSGNGGSTLEISNVELVDGLVPIPEPASAVIFGLGVVGCALRRRLRGRG